MLSLHHHRPLYTTSVQLNSQPAPPSPSNLIETPRSMDEQLSLPIHDSFEFEAEMIIMQEQVTAAQDEGNRTKQQLRDAENEALRKQNQELTVSKEVLKARAELCRNVHDTETKDIFGDPSVCRILAAGRRCRRGKKCKYGRHPDGY
jgi:hypothetical protein